MKKCSVSLLSKAKILISVILAVTVVCTMAVSISAADANAGYTTANATVFTPMDLLETTMGSSTVSKSLTLKDSLDNSVWKFAVNGTVLTTTNSVIANRYYLDSYIEYTSSDASSKYDFYGSTNSYGGTKYNYTVRTIKFTVANGEKMTFGFTAPTAGTYEISAPITATGANVRYAVYKTSADGRACLQEWQDYTAAGVFCGLPVTLVAGDTVWLEATADDGAVIDIGIPRVIKQTENKGVTDNGNNSYTYKYRAMDYFELATANGLSYGTYAAPSNITGAWEFGYFKDTGTFGAKAGKFETSGLALGASELSGNTTRTSPLPKNLRAAMRKHEIIIEKGSRYAAYDLESLSAPSIDVKAASVVTPQSSGGSTLDAYDKILTRFRTTSETSDGTEYTQYGNWFEFTAPVSGKATFTYPAIDLKDRCVMVVALNDKNILRTFSTTTGSTTYEFGNISAGDKITVLYYPFKSPTTNLTIEPPTITLTGTYNTLKLDADGGEDSFEKYVANGTEVTLPTPKKDGADFLGWSDGENTYKGGDVYTVTTDATLTATYQSLESQVDYDLDGDYVVDGADLVILRNYLLENGIIAEDRLPFADKNGKEGIDVRDLVHIRALIAVS